MAELWRESYCEGKGRILVASKNIAAGSVVLEDQCMLAAPDGVPACLSCLQPLPPAPPLLSGWPMCNQSCVETVLPEVEAECQMFNENGIKPSLQAYRIIPILRLLNIKRTQPQLYQATVERFESHWEVRKQQPEAANFIKYIGAFIRKRLGQDWVSDSDVEHVYGVLKTNGVGHLTGPGTRAVFLYPHVSLMSHSCVSNTEISSHPDRAIQFVAKCEIKKGEELTWSYGNILLPRTSLQSTLKQTWMFQCQCPRCSDPSELGLHYSMIKGHGHFDVNNNIKDQSVFKEEEGLCSNVMKTILSSNPSQLLDIYRHIKDDTKIHPTHYVRTRLYLRLMDLAVKSEDVDTMKVAEECGETLVTVLKTLEGGEGKLTRKYKTMFSVIQYKIGVI